MPAKVVRAFEDYWDLGEDRSLQKLAARYRTARNAGEKVPTVQPSTLKRWSGEFDWQERIAQRTAQELMERRRRLKARVERMRETAMTGLEADIHRYIQQLRANKGDPILVKSLDSLSKALEEFFKLGGEPLAQRFELTGAGGGAVQVQSDATITVQGAGTGAILAILDEVGAFEAGPGEEARDAAPDAVHSAQPDAEASGLPAA